MILKSVEADDITKRWNIEREVSPRQITVNEHDIDDESQIMNSISTNQITGPSAPKPESSFSFFSTHNTSTQREIVNKHNELRRMTNPTAANILKMRERDICIHLFFFLVAGCGENIYMSTAIKPWSDVIQDFYNEVKDFQYGYGPTKKAVIGHYTQLVWATSHQLGCALTHCPHEKFQYFYVCHYCPAGNIKRSDRPDALYKPYKRGKACSDCPDHCDNGLCKKQIKEAVLAALLCADVIGLTPPQKPQESLMIQ
ncbi:cysteine-rich venom protein VAR8-like [Petaurus breviceps papuanus]|uniref:cysteine-rich venom protein VAR8-like n=1 Tax=Petaurus breviceps papuanus TaxID=3040969 RepID=UPI0036D7612E